MNNAVRALAAFNNELIAGGNFTTAGGLAANFIGRWDGAAWQPLGSGINGSVAALAIFNNELIAGGGFSTAGGVAADKIALWNGTSWQALGSGLIAGSIDSLIVSNNELIAGGNINSPFNQIARWNGTAWQPLGGGMNGQVRALTPFNDELIAGGGFAAAGGNASGYWARWSCALIAAANPPASNPYGDGVFRDVLQNTAEALVPQGIGVAGTPSEGSYDYASITITFNGTPTPAPDAFNTSLTCTDITGNGPSDCPSIATISGSGSGPYQITLSAPPPPRECITFAFAGTAPNQKLQYQVLPGHTNLDGAVSTQDLLFLVQRINDGTANIPANYARFNINRSQEPSGVHVNTQDLLRLVQLLNGTNTTQAFNGATVAACPP